MSVVHPKVSVIIPAHNAGEFIQATLESVLGQTFRDFEVLVVDDGSADDTPAVVRLFGPSVHYLYQPNSGPSAARNLGIVHSTGQVVSFLDADDLWDPELLERQVEVLEAQSETDAVYTWVRFIDRSGGPLPDSLCSGVDGLTLRRVLGGGTPVQFSALAVRKEVFERIGLFDPALRQSEDWDLIVRMLSAGVRFACIPRLLVQRRVHPDSLTADPGDALRWARLAREKAFTVLPLPPDCRALAPLATFRIVLRAAMGYWRRGVRGAAVEHLIEAFEAWPAAVHRPQTYLGIISRLLPSGHRSDAEVLNSLHGLSGEAARILRELFQHPHLPAQMRGRRRMAWSAFHAAVALLYLRRRSWTAVTRHALRSLTISPGTPIRGVVSLAVAAMTRK